MGDDKRPANPVGGPSSDDAQDQTRSQHGPPDPSWPASSPLPEVIDGYRVVRLIGQGGMGMVFEAEQQEPLRRVALKILRGSAHTDDLHVRLFRREVETLARLRHPNIAAIYGSGRLPDSRPYFAMELVEGPTLDAYLRGRPSPSQRDELEHRLGLMRKIIEAVHYAHQRGVIHRDLKPSNIVVTAGFSTKSAPSGAAPLPEVKILDFGLARITDADAGATLLSEVGTIRGTLQYMSPEQALGRVDEIDVRSDVYALGVILYESLAGARPYDVQRGAMAEAVRVICEEPPRLMRDTSSGVRRVDADLQTIVFKALAKESERRYGSAAALAEDLERYLASQPILARPPSAAYQVRKLIERNRALAAAMVVVLLVVVGASVVSTALYLRARTEAAKAEQVASFLGNMLTGVGPSVARGRDTAMLREILDGTAKRISDELSQQPEVAAGIEHVLGATYQQLGELDAAEKHLDAALATHRRLNAGDNPSTAADLSALAIVHWNRGALADAEALLRETLTMRRRLDPQPNVRVAETLTDLGNVLVDAGRYDEAEGYLREGLDLKRGVLGQEDAAIALSLNSLGNLQHYRGTNDQALSLHREALAMHRRLLGEDHPDVVVDLSNIGSLLMDQGNLDAAETTMREAVDAARRLYGREHPRLAGILVNLGSVLRLQSKWAAAEEVFREAVEMNRRLHGDGTAPVADALSPLALVIAERQGQAAAEPLQREVLAIHRRTLGQDHPAIATDLANLAFGLADQGKYEEAELLYREALALVVAQYGEQHVKTLQIENNIGRLYRSKGDLGAAEEVFRKVLAGRRQTLGEKHDQVAVSMSDLATVLREEGRLDEAEAGLREALALFDATLGEKHAATIVTHGSHGRVLCDLGRCAEAEPELRKSRDGLAASYGATHERTLLVNVSLARAVAAKGDEREADALFKTVVESLPGAIQPTALAEARGLYGVFLARVGRFEHAETQLLAAEKALRLPKGMDARRRAVLDGLVKLYERWDAVKPGAGKSGEAARWRAAVSGSPGPP